MIKRLQLFRPSSNRRWPPKYELPIFWVHARIKFIWRWLVVRSPAIAIQFAECRYELGDELFVGLSVHSRQSNPGCAISQQEYRALTRMSGVSRNENNQPRGSPLVTRHVNPQFLATTPAHVHAPSLWLTAKANS